jgi:solute carrier family 35, member F5
MLITLSSDYILVIAMLKTTPVVATLGLSLTIPLAIVGDAILNKPTKAQAGLGALLVLVSFGLVGWADADTVSQDDGQVEDGSLQEIPQGSPGIEQSGGRDT